MKNLDKIKGALYGVAVGDALGAPLEFMTADEIKRKHGTVRDMIGGGWLDVEPGEITDDTQMTLAVAQGIVEAPQNPVEAIGTHFVEWVNTLPKDIGATCARSIYGATRNAEDPKRPSELDWLEASLDTDRSMNGRTGGNGALMRTVYVGLYYNTIGTIRTHAQNICRMTHYDTRARNDCADYSRIVYHLINGVDLYRSIALGLYNSTTHSMEYISNKSFTPKSTGYGIDSFDVALYCVLTTKTFEDALIKAVNLGGDADTIGAITGGLAGALYGFNAIPERWASRLSLSVTGTLDALAEEAANNR